MDKPPVHCLQFADQAIEQGVLRARRAVRQYAVILEAAVMIDRLFVHAATVVVFAVKDNELFTTI